MKKSVIGLLCAVLLFSLTGCGSKKLTEGKDIYEKLKEEGIKVNLYYSNYQGVDRFDIKMVVDNYEIYYSQDSNNDNLHLNYTNTKDEEKTIIGSVDESGELFLLASAGDCYNILTSDEEIPDGFCSETGLSDINDLEKDMNKILEKLNVDNEGLINFFKWYVQEEGERAKAKK